MRGSSWSSPSRAGLGQAGPAGGSLCWTPQSVLRLVHIILSYVPSACSLIDSSWSIHPTVPLSIYSTLRGSDSWEGRREARPAALAELTRHRPGTPDKQGSQHAGSVSSQTPAILCYFTCSKTHWCFSCPKLAPTALMPNLSPRSEHPPMPGPDGLAGPTALLCPTSRNHSSASPAAPRPPLPGASPLRCAGLLLFGHETPCGRTRTQASLPGPRAPRFPRLYRPAARPPRVVQRPCRDPRLLPVPAENPTRFTRQLPQAELPPDAAGLFCGFQPVCLSGLGIRPGSLQAQPRATVCRRCEAGAQDPSWQPLHVLACPLSSRFPRTSLT